MVGSVEKVHKCMCCAGQGRGAPMALSALSPAIGAIRRIKEPPGLSQFCPARTLATAGV